jgi:hypothetical protein
MNSAEDGTLCIQRYIWTHSIAAPVLIAGCGKAPHAVSVGWPIYPRMGNNGSVENKAQASLHCGIITR